MKKKTNMSKLLATIAIIQFLVVIVYSIATSWLMWSAEALSYLIPSSAALATAATTFYYNKAKMENLSKQKIRGVYLKLFLEEKLSPEAFAEIEEELNNIDDIIEQKLDSSYQEIVEEQIEEN